MNQIQKTIANQINAKELTLANFTLLTEGENTLHIKKGGRYIIITYNLKNDLYDLRLGVIDHKLKITEKTTENLYADQLQDIIQNFFPKFEYIMNSIMGVTP
jgi:hypothetical protein